MLRAPLKYRFYDRTATLCAGKLSIAAFLLFLITCLTQAAQAAKPVAVTRASSQPPTREIFVPQDDLEVILEQASQRVFLSRAEYAELVAKAESQPDPRPPVSVVLLSAEYDARVEDQRGRLEATLELDVLDDALHAVPLDLAPTGLLSVLLDERSAALGRGSEGRPVLFVSGKGRHRLRLVQLLPLSTSAAQQTLRFHVPVPGATQFHLTVPGDVDVKHGATVADRRVDEPSQVTRLTLLPNRGPNEVVMTLNNRRLRDERVVTAQSVIVDELTEAYEQLHVTASLHVLHGAVDQFRFSVPQGFEITGVRSPLVARWALEQQDERSVLVVSLREATRERVVLGITAMRIGVELDDWTMPRLAPLDVAAHVAIVGVLVEQRLKPRALQASGVIPLDTEVLFRTLPASVVEGDPSAPTVRPVFASYAPQAAFEVSAAFEKPAARVRSTTNVLVMLKETRLEAHGGFALLPVAEKIFGCEFTAPAGWQVLSVTYGNDQPLQYETYPGDDGAARIRVRLPRAVPAGEAYSIRFHAVHTPPEWLSTWTEKEIEFPHFAILDAAQDTGAIAVQVHDDLVAHEVEVEGLIPLDENKKAEYGMAGVPTSLAYRYEHLPYRARLKVERTAPRITAETFSFFRVAADHLAVRYELIYDITEARTKTLALSLPAETPAELSIVGLDGLALKQSDSRIDGPRRVWSVKLAEPRFGTVRLAVDFQQRRKQEAAADVTLPVVHAEGVAHQSGMVSVEGSPELDVEILAGHPRKVDVGKLIDAKYQPGRHLLGVFGFTGTSASVKLSVARPEGYLLPSAIVERAELVTLVSKSGRSQTAARFHLRTKASYLEVELPEDSTLWSVYLDGKPTKPQREAKRLLLNLPSTGSAALRDLRIVYETPVASLALWSNLEVPAPRLALRGETESKAQDLPVADLQWRLYLPTGYELVESHGTVFTDANRRVALLVDDSVSNELKGWLPSASLASEPKAATTSEYYAAEADDAGGFADAPASSSDDFAQDAEMPAEEAEVMGEGVNSDPGVTGGASEDPTAQPADMPDDAAPAPPAPKPQPTGAPEPLKPTQATPPPPPTSVQGARTTHATPDVGKARHEWALAGLRSLKIDLVESGEAISFQSLGSDPRLSVTLVDRRRARFLAWGVYLSVLLIGVLITRRPARVKAQFVILVWLLATLLPLVLPWRVALAAVLDAAFDAATVLAVYYLIVGGARMIWSALADRWSPAAAAGLMLALVAFSSQSAVAAPPAKPGGAAPYVVQVVGPPRPVNVPDDAIIVPYDPDAEEGVEKAETLLIPYARYVELWNRAFPEKPIATATTPAPYATAGAVYEAALTDGDDLLITGKLDVEVYDAGVVTIPLPFQGGVLVSAAVAGEPARLQVLKPQLVSANQSDQGKMQAQQRVQAAPTVEAGPEMVALYLSGKGRRSLNVAMRFPLVRQGGWRIAEGRLPSGPAGSLAVRIDKAETELRFGRGDTTTRFETKADDETIELALASQGSFRIEWRPKVVEHVVDQSLTAESRAVLDIQEDGVRLTWQLDLAFRHGLRESFVVLVPADYLVDEVTGANVRGWEVNQADPQNRLDVSLLKAVTGSEQFTVYLSKRGGVAQAMPEDFTAPVVTVEGAALHRGQLTVRRSPMLEVRTGETTGLTRADVAAGNNQPDISFVEESPLGIRAYQSFRFVATPYTLPLAVAPAKGRASARVQSIVRIGDRERQLESRVLIRAEGRPVYRARIVLPEDLRLERRDQVQAPEPFEWSISEVENRRVLNLFLTTGQLGEFAVDVRGTLGEAGTREQVELPRLEVLDVDRQEGDLVILADPGLEVRTADTEGCAAVLMSRVAAWLSGGQRPLARLALHYPAPGYSGNVLIEPRQPTVRCTVVTNVRVTDQAVEETILLDYVVEQAGVREVRWQMPASMSDARISTPLLRQKQIEAVDDQTVRVRLSLQDEVMGRLRVLVENDRLPSETNHAAPVPLVESAESVVRYVVLETAGRDEVAVEQAEGYELLARHQTEWQKLAELLGSQITQAYLVRAKGAAPLLLFKSQGRQTVETVGARIGLAQTKLMLDAAGAYRAVQTYRVDNRTEQFLEVALPEGAELWAVQVAGASVKPAVSKTRGEVRIPLVKTAEGDQDFAVVLKYAGQLGSLGNTRRVAFPLPRTLNINVELSQVRLWLPRQFQWLNFDGSMRLVNEGDLAAGYYTYQTRQIQKLAEALSSDNEFASVRAKSNLKQLGRELESFAEDTQQFRRNAEYQKEQRGNYRVWEQAQQQIVDEERQPQSGDYAGNAGRLNDLYRQQEIARSKNVVSDLDYNFQDAKKGKSKAPGSQRFNERWYAQNKLESSVKLDAQSAGKRIAQQSTSRQSGEGKEGDKLRESKPRAPVIVEGQQQGGHRGPYGYGAVPGSPDANAPGRQALGQRRSRKDQLDRYEAQLEGQQAAPSYPAAQPGGEQTTRSQITNGPMPPQTANDTPPAADELVGPVLGGEVLDLSDRRTKFSDSGLASLDVEFPERGVEYLFTTPRGEIEITARAVSSPLVDRFWSLLGLALIVAVAVVGYRLVRRIWLGLHTPAAA